MCIHIYILQGILSNSIIVQIIQVAIVSTVLTPLKPDPRPVAARSLARHVTVVPCQEFLYTPKALNPKLKTLRFNEKTETLDWQNVPGLRGSEGTPSCGKYIKVSAQSPTSTLPCKPLQKRYTAL